VSSKRWAGILLLSAGCLVLRLLPLSAAGAEDWIVLTDRRDNPWISEYLLWGDYSQSARLIAGLGTRADPYISDILQTLTAQFSASRGYQQQELMRSLLHAVFPPEAPEGELTRRIAANQDGLELLARGLDEFLLPLRRESVRVLRLSGSADFDRDILGQAAWCYHLLRVQAGRTEAEQGALILELLEYAAARRDPVFLDPVLRILEATRNQVVAEKALQTARALAGVRTVFQSRGER
jgi:hypothetical protein